MKSSNFVLDPRLAWTLCRELTKVRPLLWDCHSNRIEKSCHHLIFRAYYYISCSDYLL